MTDPGTKVEPKPLASPDGGGYLCNSSCPPVGPPPLRWCTGPALASQGTAWTLYLLDPPFIPGKGWRASRGGPETWTRVSGHFWSTFQYDNSNKRWSEVTSRSDAVWPSSVLREKKGPPNGLGLWSIALQQGWKVWKGWSLKEMQRAPFPLIPSWKGRLLIAMCVFRGLSHCLLTRRVNTSTVTA